MKGLGSAIVVYEHYNARKYPTAAKWCDLLVEQAKVTPKQLVCKGAATRGNTARCHYAMNPDCEPNSPPDAVLLFETKGGWNQYGGPEILTTENHEGKGCNVLFNDGHVRFVPSDELSLLRWNAGEPNNVK
ncbi:MAG: H-X9-DG-CTERM domain-containing protein [Planctomycetota bacterium]|jgi:prepilin-type processing-associated H-X9-DG protein